MASYNYTVPVLIEGGIQAYSNGKECEKFNYGWNCYFLPLSNCEDVIRSTGVRIDLRVTDFDEIHPFIREHSPRYERKKRRSKMRRQIQPLTFSDDDVRLIPFQFRHLGLPVWWGIIQTFLFRFQPDIYDYIVESSNNFGYCNSFPFGKSIIGVHVRHGDKKDDLFKVHSFESELKASLKSPECITKDFDSYSCYKSTSSTLKDKLPVFVASDNPQVLSKAKSLGHLSHSFGISQDTKIVGMAKYLVRTEN